MYDYYIAMKSMFLVAKLFSHLSIGYASLTILLPWIKHKQHQNHAKSKTFQNQIFNSHKLCIHTITLYKWKCFSRSQTPPYILTKRKLIKKLPKTYSPYGSPNNQKERKSHGSLGDSTINHKETISHDSPSDSPSDHKETIAHGSPGESTINHKEIISHGSPGESIINHKEIISHDSPCDSTINHKETTSHGSPCDSTINHKKTISHDSPCESTINHKKTTSHVSPCDSIINHKETISHGALTYGILPPNLPL